MTSSASSGSSGGRIVGSRCASRVLPAPGGPCSRRWCPPAAATSMAQRPSSCPTTSARSTPNGVGGSGSAGGGRSGSGAVPVRTSTSSRRWSTAMTRMPGTSEASASVRHRHDHVLESGVPRGQDAGQHPTDSADPAVQPEFPDAHQPTHPLRLYHLGSREQPDRDRDVEGTAVLVQRGRREVDGHLGVGPARPAVVHGRAHPITRLVERGVGQADDRRAGQPGCDVHLDVDHLTAHPGQCDRPGAGERHRQITPRTCCTVAGPLRLARTPTTSKRTARGCSPRSASQRAARTRWRAALRSVTASRGVP